MVKQIKKIMVPLAFSSFSRDMVEFAAQLARPFAAELILVNVINERDVEAVQRITSFGYEVNEEDYVRAIEKQRVEKVEAMVREIDFPEEKIHMIFKVGRPASTLLKVALKEDERIEELPPELSPWVIEMKIEGNRLYFRLRLSPGAPRPEEAAARLLGLPVEEVLARGIKRIA